MTHPTLATERHSALSQHEIDRRFAEIMHSNRVQGARTALLGFGHKATGILTDAARTLKVTAAVGAANTALRSAGRTIVAKAKFFSVVSLIGAYACDPQTRSLVNAAGAKVLRFVGKVIAPADRLIDKGLRKVGLAKVADWRMKNGLLLRLMVSFGWQRAQGTLDRFQATSGARWGAWLFRTRIFSSFSKAFVPDSLRPYAYIAWLSYGASTARNTGSPVASSPAEEAAVAKARTVLTMPSAEPVQVLDHNTGLVIEGERFYAPDGSVVYMFEGNFWSSQDLKDRKLQAVAHGTVTLGAEGKTSDRPLRRPQGRGPVTAAEMPKGVPTPKQVKTRLRKPPAA